MNPSHWKEKDMDPVIVQRAPFVIDEEPGQKAWCACGKSQKQPYCDGSHRGCGITPIKLQIEEAKRVAWCGCKHSKNPPFCDGSHRNLPAD